MKLLDLYLSLIFLSSCILFTDAVVLYDVRVICTCGISQEMWFGQFDFNLEKKIHQQPRSFQVKAKSSQLNTQKSLKCNPFILPKSPDSLGFFRSDLH